VPSVADILAEAIAHLTFGPHPERARADAELLLQHALYVNKAWLLAHGDDCLAAQSVARYCELITRRRAGEPIQYITGEAEFLGLPLRVAPGVLIPRPETEHLVEKALEFAAQFVSPRIVDIGTGSGAIAIALAHALPRAEILATDISEVALAMAASNAERNRLAERIRFVRADLLAPVGADIVANERGLSGFDIVVSNPPYVPEADRASLAVEVRDHEPALALFAGEDGLAVYRRLILDAFGALATDGWLALEIGFGQADSIADLLAAAGFRNAAFTPDLQGIPRVASAQR
jgi:release factor glutamine methyltransferase